MDNRPSPAKLDMDVSTIEQLYLLYQKSLQESWSDLRIREELECYSVENPAWISAGLPDPLIVDLSEMEQVFGVTATNAFRNLFITERGRLAGYTFFAGSNPVENYPLIKSSDSTAYCPLANLLHVALVNRLAHALESDSAVREAFLRHRDVVLEQQTETLVRDFFGPDAEIFASVAEFPNRAYEHDVFVIWKRTAFVFEAKASPPVEPFRDVERAFTRIDRAFRSDRGIQKAFEQGMRLVRRIRDGEEIILYGEQGTVVGRVGPGVIEDVYPVCVTAEDYGPIAIDLSLLLKKEPNPA